MKKILLIILTLSFGVNALAAFPPGCLSLTNSQWEGDAYMSDNTRKDFSLSIQNVIRHGAIYYLTGSLNNKQLYKSRCVPDENNPTAIVTVIIQQNSGTTLMMVLDFDNANYPLVMELPLGGFLDGQPFNNGVIFR